MNSLKQYFRIEKVKRIRQFEQDILNDFGITVKEGQGFTRSDMFYFGIVDNKKYVHKESMKFVLTNGYTYQVHQPIGEEIVFNKNIIEIEKINKNVERMFDFYRQDINHHKLYPDLLEESENFFVFKYYGAGWQNIIELRKEDSRYIKEHFIKSFRNTDEVVTPFYNQMSKKLVHNVKTGEIVMVDLKSLEFRPKSDLAVYMYNDIVNDLYLLQIRFASKNKILAPYSLDYPSQAARIHRHYDWF